MSAGDSFSAGEGIGDQVVDKTCARSNLAYGPVAARLLRDQRGWKTKKEVFVACTGDVMADFFEQRPPDGVPPNRRSQLDWAADQGLSKATKSDVLLFSFGGNDIGFDDVIKDCLAVSSWADVVSRSPFADRCSPVDGQPIADGLVKRVDDLVDTGHRSPALDKKGSAPGRAEKYGALVNVYKKLLAERVTDEGVLVVVGYPRLFAPNTHGQWGDWRGDRCAGMFTDDATALGRVAEHLDQRLADAVSAADPTGKRIQYLSRVALYDGPGENDSHSLCGGNTEWLNRETLGLNDPEPRYERSFHPNEPGHAATAELLASTLDSWSSAAAPTTTIQTAPIVTTPITSGRDFNIGDRFSSTCVVAWPTAPVRSRSGTDMRMSCSGVPSQFLFVDVHSSDRNLPITPSTGNVTVTGKIVDVAESEYGFRTLVVEASSVNF